MTVWETFWALDDIGKFEVLAPSVFTAFYVCITLWLVMIIYRSVRALRTSGHVILKPRPTLGMSVVYGLLVVSLLPALVFLLAATCKLFNTIEVTSGGSCGSSWMPENLTRLLLPVACSFVCYGLFVLYFCIVWVSYLFHSFTIRDGGILAYLDCFISPFTTWTCVRRAIWCKPNTICIELDNGCHKFSVHSMYVESVSESLARFVEVVDHDTYIAAGKKVYPRPRYRLQFRLRTLMLVTLLLAVFMVNLGGRLREAVRIRQIAARLVESGATVGYLGLDIQDVSWGEDGRQPTDDDLAILEELDYVRYLYICGPHVTDDGLQHLRSLTTLHSLILVKTNITGKGLEHVASLERLESLLIRDTPISDAGLRQIGKLKSLRDLTLNGTQITDYDLGHLAGLTNLSDLNLDNTKISGKGLGHLEGIQSLKDLSLEKAPITDDGLQQIGKLKSLEHLILCGTQVADAGLVHLAGLKNLKELQLDNTKITGKGLGYLAAIHCFKNLSLDNAPITDDGLQQIGKLKSLEYLSLNGTQVTDAGLVYIADLSKLYSLNLDDTKISGQGLGRIAPLETLRFLSLVGTKVTDKTLDDLEQLPVLCSVNVTETASGTDDADEEFPGMNVEALPSPELSKDKTITDEVKDE